VTITRVKGDPEAEVAEEVVETVVVEAEPEPEPVARRRAARAALSWLGVAVTLAAAAALVARVMGVRLPVRVTVER